MFRHYVRAALILLSIPRQFEGTMNYGTRCHKCKHASERPASFLELEVSLTVRLIPFVM